MVATIDNMQRKLFSPAAQLLILLLERGKKTNTEVAKLLGHTEPYISRELTLLAVAELISRRKAAGETINGLTPKGVKIAEAFQRAMTLWQRGPET